MIPLKNKFDNYMLLKILKRYGPDFINKLAVLEDITDIVRYRTSKNTVIKNIQRILSILAFLYISLLVFVVPGVCNNVYNKTKFLKSYSHLMNSDALVYVGWGYINELW